MYKGLMEYLESCPQLQGQKFNFDFIGARPVEFTLSIPTNTPEITSDTMGNTKCVQVFYLTSVVPFGEDVMNNIENLDLFQKVRKWFEKQNRQKNYPDFGEGNTVTGVYATTDGYIEATTTSVGRYQMQCKVEYTKENQNPNKPPKWF